MKLTAARRRPPMDWEGVEQEAFFNWLRLRHPEAWEYTFHPPNGGARHAVVAAKLKSQGVKPGVPDIVMELPRGAYHGLRIELKATPPRNAAVAQSQRDWMFRLNAVGYCALLCLGVDAARTATELYLNLGPYDDKTIHPSFSR